MESNFKDSYKSKYEYSRLKSGVIFVAIASYRDTRCLQTVKNLFETADNPHKLIIGICQQNDRKDPDCGMIPKERLCQVKIMRLSHNEAKGPTWARYLASHMWDGEEFYLQVDAHMNFIKGWDTSLKEMRNILGVRKNVITFYPPPDTGTADLNTVTVLTTTATINDKGEMISKGEVKPKISYPRETNFISAGFIFTNWEFLMDIPFDPYLPYLFQGEEPLLAMRLWTSGWKIFNPTHCLCDHYYERLGEPKFWNDHTEKYNRWNKVSKLRALVFLGVIKKPTDVPQEIFKFKETYGPGRARTVDAWLAMLKTKFGVDWKAAFDKRM